MGEHYPVHEISSSYRTSMFVTVYAKPWLSADYWKLTLPSAEELVVLTSTNNFKIKRLVKEANFI